jgi:hypothetical protein
MNRFFILLISIFIVGLFVFMANKIRNDRSIVNVENQSEQRNQDSLANEKTKHEQAELERIKQEQKARNEKKLAALVDDYTNKLTLEMMSNTCQNTGKKSNFSCMSYDLNEFSNTLIIVVQSSWLGKSSYFSNEELNQVKIKTSIFGSDKKTFVEVLEDNEALRNTKQNREIMSFIENTYNIGLDVLCSYTNFKNNNLFEGA